MYCCRSTVSSLALFGGERERRVSHRDRESLEAGAEWVDSSLVSASGQLLCHSLSCLYIEKYSCHGDIHHRTEQLVKLKHIDLPPDEEDRGPV